MFSLKNKKVVKHVVNYRALENRT